MDLPCILVRYMTRNYAFQVVCGTDQVLFMRNFRAVTSVTVSYTQGFHNCNRRGKPLARPDPLPTYLMMMVTHAILNDT